MSAVTPDLYFENETFISEQILDARLVEVPDSRFLRLVFDKAISEQEKVTQRISEIGGRNYQYFIFKGRPTKPQLTKEEQAKKYQQPTKPQLAEEDQAKNAFMCFLGLLLVFIVFMVIMACVL